ncbi:MAG: DNA-processing protein DprA [Clostridiales Family XIII bacterium]|jgi:DNA processing protein|nr:DNA-processing protein DprA [Clostridiales Family XIII bacterium]
MAAKGLIKKSDAGYPLLLSLIPNPPEHLYYCGDASLLETFTVAVVGARRCTEYGSWAAYNIAKRLSQYGVTVVSGMAEGIDSHAHRGALDGGSPTVAVWGCGLDYCFPRRNEKLMDEILSNGLIITEYEEGVRPNKFTFPMRNRIISGISFAVVVAEAAVRSGSLITAELAVDQGRDVYAVPGNINREKSVGCNKLIYDGAKPVIFIDDILRDLGIDKVKEQRRDVSLSPDERLAYEAVMKNGEMGYEEFARVLRRGIASATSLAVAMEMKGLFVTSAGKIMIP